LSILESNIVKHYDIIETKKCKKKTSPALPKSPLLKAFPVNRKWKTNEKLGDSF
jgi:hypothetical protein